MKQAVGIIPARYGSTRFPGKPLAAILGKPMLQWVYERACSARNLSRVIIATDDERILTASKAFGAEAIKTSASIVSGTERAAEVARDLDSQIIINIQGDEPLIKAEMIDSLVEALQEDSLPMATLVLKTKDLTLHKDKNIVKVVIDEQGFALYFSRSPVPFQASDYFWQHIGIYGYQKTFLLRFSRLPASRLEKTEDLEQLRALENGFRIKAIETLHSTLSVDAPEDIIKVEKKIKEGTD